MRRERGQTLVGLVIVIAIMAILAVAVMRPWAVGGTARPARADGKGTTVPGLAKLKAEDTVCQSNLAQVRQFIQIARSNGDDQPPATLAEIQGLPKGLPIVSPWARAVSVRPGHRDRAMRASRAREVLNHTSFWLEPHPNPSPSPVGRELRLESLRQGDEEGLRACHTLRRSLPC